MKWSRGKHYDDLTICIFSRNAVSLCYPLFESLASTIPLGCRYLVGDASSDNTIDVWYRLANHLPMEIVKIPWALDKEPGWKAVAIGIATEHTIALCKTKVAYNLQLSEVLDDDAVTAINSQDSLEPSSFWFRHFYGNMHYGNRAFHGYGDAPRIFTPGTKFDRTDGAHPNGYCGGYKPLEGHINRYGYCWKNTIINKGQNKNSLYDGENNTVQRSTNFYNDCKNDVSKHIYPRENHPSCVRHLIDLENYDINISEKWFLDFY